MRAEDWNRRRNVSPRGFRARQGSAESADFRQGVSINIYGDIRKVKRNPIIELFRSRPIPPLIGRPLPLVTTNPSFPLSGFCFVYENLVYLQIPRRAPVHGPRKFYGSYYVAFRQVENTRFLSLEPGPRERPG